MSEGLFAHPGAHKHVWRVAEKEVPTIYQVFASLGLHFSTLLSPYVGLPPSFPRIEYCRSLSLKSQLEEPLFGGRLGVSTENQQPGPRVHNMFTDALYQLLISEEEDCPDAFLNSWKRKRDEEEEEDINLIHRAYNSSKSKREPPMKKKRAKNSESVFMYVIDKLTGLPRPGIPGDMLTRVVKEPTT